MGNRKAKIFSIAFLLSLAVYFILANFYKTYQSEVDILIVPQNKKTALMQKEVLGNAARIPLSVSFFDKLAKDNLELESAVQGLSASERRAHWNSKLQTEIQKDSGILRFKTLEKDLDQAESIALDAASADIIELSRYYNIKEDVQMRIIDGPITENSAAYGSFYVIFVSLTFGAISAILLYLVIPFIQNKLSLPDETSYVKALPDDAFVLKKDFQLEPEKQEMEEIFYSIPEKESAPKEKPQEIIETIPETKEIPAAPIFKTEAESYGKKSSAPENLPTAGDTIQSMFGATKNGMGYKMSVEKKATEQKEEKPAVYREATPEEVKERLNKLLGGM